ncbi:MAG: hypothetical protein P8080_04540 [Gammaproteobacteria bacterium]
MPTNLITRLPILAMALAVCLPAADAEETCPGYGYEPTHAEHT